MKLGHCDINTIDTAVIILKFQTLHPCNVIHGISFRHLYLKHINIDVIADRIDPDQK